MFASQEIPFWGYLGLAMAMAALFEARRNSGRVDAIIRLSELEGRDGERGERISSKSVADTDQPLMNTDRH